MASRLSIAAILSLLLLVGFSCSKKFPFFRRAPRPPAAEVWVEDQLKGLSLEQKVSQLFSVSANGVFLGTDDPTYRQLVRLVEDFAIGGLVLFQGEPQAQIELLNDLQARAKLPLLVSQDMEWGPGMRLPGTTILPTAMAIGATGDTGYAYAAGYLTGTEARALGVQQVLAPVADVNNNPDNPVINVRSFGEQAGFVSDMVAAYVRGVQEAGALATVKHFPGHGDTGVDSHLALPALPYGRQRLDTLELAPFRSAIAAGVGSVMIGHLALPTLTSDPKLPATLSPAVVRGLLRKELGFDGLVVSDAMNMAGLTLQYDPGEAAVRAVAAGVDMLMLSADVYAARDALLLAVEEGRLSEKQIDASVRRILAAKARMGLPWGRQVDPGAARQRVATRSHAALSARMARASLTLLSNRDGLIPLSDAGKHLLSVTLSDNMDPEADAPFLGALRQHTPPAHLAARRLDPQSGAQDYNTLLKEAASFDAVVLPTFMHLRSLGAHHDLPSGHREFVNDLIKTGKPVALISFGNPYLLRSLSALPNVYLAAYGDSPASQQAAADALFGATSIKGRLPVSIPDHYAPGAGLQLPQQTLRAGLPEEVGMSSMTLYRIDSLLHAAVSAHAFPGAALAIGRKEALARLEGYGYFTYKAEHPVTPQSLFDLASLTKVIVTTTAVMQLYESGRLDLDAPVARFLPAFAQNGKGAITIRHLLTHTSGLIPFRAFHQLGLTTPDAVMNAIYAEKLVYETGTDMRYSDFGPILIGRIIEQITGQPLDIYAREHIFEPLGMTRTGFRKAGVGSDPTIVPTEVDKSFRKRLVQGEVHDETAFILGGTAGHAGLFSTAEDLARFAYMMLNGGHINGQSFLKEETIRLFTTRVDTSGIHTRALGWDTKAPEGYSSAGTLFGPHSFGHTGFTGTSFWIDPDEGLFVILLTNRVYPTRDNRKHIPVRADVADLAFRALHTDNARPLSIAPPTPASQ